MSHMTQYKYACNTESSSSSSWISSRRCDTRRIRLRSNHWQNGTAAAAAAAARKHQACSDRDFLILFPYLHADTTSLLTGHKNKNSDKYCAIVMLVFTLLCILFCSSGQLFENIRIQQQYAVIWCRWILTVCRWYDIIGRLWNHNRYY